jgi:glucose/arabinose dehydrogenase
MRAHLASRPRRRPTAPVRLALEQLEGRLVPAVLPAGFAESVVGSGISRGTAMEISPDGRLFVAEQGGTMKVFQNGALLQPDFFRDTPLTVGSNGERGLLGIAFDPHYEADHFVYVYYTATTPVTHNRVSRFTADGAGDLALPGSEAVLLDLDPLSAATNHNGGAIHFGLDGKLYVGVGENANPANSQTLTNLLGKVLRINPDGSVPADNPFVGVAGARGEIYALGFRNPFTFAVQPGTGRIFVNDVGSSPPQAREEIDQLVAGGNYGWPINEGPTDTPGFISPIYSYDHSLGRCAIVGGAFYDPAVNQFPPAYVGSYFFGDLCSGQISRLDPTTGAVTTFASGISNLVDLKVDPQGNLYYLAQGGGQVVQVHFTAAEKAAAIGAFDRGSGTWFLRRTAAGGAPDAGQFAYGAPGWLPVVGDWNGDGVDTVGVFDPASATWFLRDENSAGAPDAGVFAYGVAGWLPVAGDWAGTGHVGIGVFDPATATWYLRSSPTAGAPDVGVFRYGAAGWLPVVGDWSGTGHLGIGVFDPTTATWYLRNEVGPGAPDAGVFRYGVAGWLPVVGDWTGSGRTGIGAVDPTAFTWYLRSEANAGAPDAGLFAYGGTGWIPVGGTFALPAPSPAADVPRAASATAGLGDALLSQLPTSATATAVTGDCGCGRMEDGSGLDGLDRLFASGV